MNIKEQQTTLSPALFLRPAQNSFIQRKCACGNKTIATGECTECSKKQNSLQRKLSIGASNDPLEREADRVADKVLAIPRNSNISISPPRIQRLTTQPTGQLDTAPVSVDHILSGSGRPMAAALKQDMEQRFGHDFSKVRVHTGKAAEQSAQDVNAKAYTVGNNMVFGAGQFSPYSSEGKKLIGHELTHTVQQSKELRRSPFDDRPDWANIPIAHEDIPDPEVRMKIMRAEAEKYRWSDALERLKKGELSDTDLQYSRIRNRMTGLKTSEISGLITKIKSFQAQRNKDIKDKNIKTPEKKKPITTVKIIQWLEVRKDISTPMPDNATVNSLLPGLIDSYSISINDINITVMPDKHGSGQNITAPTANFTGNFTWLVVGGKITDLKKNGVPFNPTKLEVTILTQYKDSPNDTSVYGKGTTSSDKSNETTTLRVHEGQHGTDFISYLTKTPLPVSLKAGINGQLTPAQFSKILDYAKGITKDTCEATDQTGFSQDQYLNTDEGKASGITSCRKP